MLFGAIKGFVIKVNLNLWILLYTPTVANLLLFGLLMMWKGWIDKGTARDLHKNTKANRSPPLRLID